MVDQSAKRNHPAAAPRVSQYLEAWDAHRRAPAQLTRRLVQAQRPPLRALRRLARGSQVATMRRASGQWWWRQVSARKRLPVVALNLERFYLGQRAAVTEPMLAEIARLDTLLWLKLSDLMTDEARQRGLPQLGHLPALRHLELGDPNVSINRNGDLTDEAVRFVGSMKSLRSLVLCFCTSLTDAALAPLAKLSGLRHLSLDLCSRLTGSGLRHLRRLDSLRHLDLSSCTQLRSASLKALRGWESLTRLDLRGCRRIGGGRALEHIGTLSGLERLDSSDCPNIGDAGLRHLAKLDRLQHLELRNCYKITNAGLGHLRGLERLTHLELDGCTKIGDAGLGHLRGLPDLSYLSLSQCEAITDAGLAHLRSLASLRTVHIHCAAVTPAGIRGLERAVPGLAVRWTAADDYWDAYERAIGCA